MGSVSKKQSRVRNRAAHMVSTPRGSDSFGTIGRYLLLGVLTLCLLTAFDRGSRSMAQTASMDSGLPNPMFIQISTELGLPGRSVRTVFQDSIGFIWMGIEDAGLVRYDGHEFTLFEADSSRTDTIAGQFITAINEDEAGYIWVGTQSGLSRLDTATGKCHSFYHDADDPKSIPGNLILDIFKDKLGRLWIGTENGFCWYDSDEGFESFLDSEQDNPALKIQVNELYEDHFGFMWISTKGGIYLFDPVSKTLEQKYGYSPSDAEHVDFTVYTCVEDLSGDLWFGTETGLLYYSRDTGEFEHVLLVEGERDPEETNVNTLFRDRLGYIWVGTFSDGLRIMDPTTRKTVRVVNDQLNDSSLRSNSVRSIMEDHAGLIWVGTKFEGVSIYDRKRETFPLTLGAKDAKPGKMSGTHVMALYEDSQERLWVGTKRGGLNLYNKATGRFKTPAYTYDADDPNSLVDNRVEDILEDSQGRLWLGTEKGFSLFDPQTDHFKNIRTHIVRELEEKDAGHLYVGTSYGLEVYDIEQDRILPFSSENLGNLLSVESRVEVKALFRDSRDILWVGTHHEGLYAYDASSNTLTEYPLVARRGNDMAEVKAVRAIQEDSLGRIWVGTKAGGLFVMDEETGSFVVAPGIEGSMLETVFAILEDSFHLFWISSASGLYQYQPDSGELTRFSVDYGLQGDVFEPNAAARGGDGQLFFGGQGGFNHFYPDQVQILPQESKMVLSRFQLIGSDEPMIVGEGDELELSHKQNYISLSFTLLDYASPGRNEYRYILHGLDEDWIYSNTRNYVSYSSMTPGEYRFEAYGKTPTGDWCKQPLTFSFSIQPPFWKTRGFIALGILIVGGIIAGVFYLAIVRERWQNAKLAKLVQEQTQDLRSANDQLEQQKEELQLKSEEIHKQNVELAQHKENLEQKVHERTEDLEQAKLMAEESDRLKSSFLANLSHEIRTPLNAIVGFTSMLEPAKNLKKGEINLVDHIQRNSSDLLRLIDNIIELSLVETEQLKLVPNDFSLRSFFRQLNEQFHGSYVCFSTGKIKLNLKLEGIPPEMVVTTDENRLRQVILNLVDNAVKFTDEGSISIKAEVLEEKVLKIVVEDSGIGISPEDQAVIFDRFRKIEKETSKLYRGSGLGLALCKHLVILLGGSIEVHSVLKQGSRFEFTIPVSVRMNKAAKPGKAVVPDEAATPEPEVTESPEPKSQKIHHHVLVVEDEESNYVFLSAALKKLGYTFDLARDGIEAVAMFESKGDQYEFILMDIKLPKMNGDQAARRIREMNDRIPIISQTAYAMEKDRARYSSYPFNAYLSKPIRIGDLDEVIGKLKGAESSQT